MQSFFLQIDVPEIVIHKADQPNTFFDFLDTDSLTSKDRAERLLLLFLTTPAIAQTPAAPNDVFIVPSRPVPVSKAPTMQAKLVKDAPDEQVYSIIFYKRRRSPEWTH